MGTGAAAWSQTKSLLVHRNGSVVYTESVSAIDSITFVSDSGTDGSYTANGVSFDMVAVPGGTTHLPTNAADTGTAVGISSFTIGKYEVTQGLWEAMMGATYPGDEPTTTLGKGASYPVYNVSWNDIVGTSGSVGYTVKGISYYTNGFCYKLSQLVGGGKEFRLPTEAEWEYAAKGGQQTHSYTYSGSNTVGDVAWYTSNSGSTSHPVGTKAANELGIYDMTGNVYEWCSDWDGSPYPRGTSNPTGAPTGSYRINRGGYWGSEATSSTLSSRGNHAPSNRYGAVGFRLALPADAGSGSTDKTVTDGDGNEYRTKVYNGVEWMIDNAQKPLTYAINACTYSSINRTTQTLNYGHLYSWNCAASACPAGWSLPTDADFTALAAALTAGGASAWADWNSGSSLAGYGASGSYLGDQGSYGNWWSSSSSNSYWFVDSGRTSGGFLTLGNNRYSHSVRCRKN
jgi:uncharacterized protein (TIGR02145 family)